MPARPVGCSKDRQWRSCNCNSSLVTIKDWKMGDKTKLKWILKRLFGGQWSHRIAEDLVSKSCGAVVVCCSMNVPLVRASVKEWAYNDCPYWLLYIVYLYVLVSITFSNSSISSAFTVSFVWIFILHNRQYGETKHMFKWNFPTSDWKENR